MLSLLYNENVSRPILLLKSNKNHALLLLRSIPQKRYFPVSFQACSVNLNLYEHYLAKLFNTPLPTISGTSAANQGPKLSAKQCAIPKRGTLRDHKG